MNYFQLFNLPIQFEVDPVGLTSTYQTLQKLTHPDKYAAASEQQKRLALQKNAQVNDAYQVLKSPLSRAEHILQLRGIELNGAQKSMQEPAFLMQQLEWREQLQQLDKGDVAVAQLESMTLDVQQHYQQHLHNLAKQLRLDSAESNKQASVEINKIKFMAKLLEEIELKEDALADF